jgi:Ca2+-binding EF-hand superfamily protein
MRKLVSLITMLGVMMFLALGAEAQVNRDAVREKVGEREGNQDAQQKAQQARDARANQEEDDDDDGANVGAIVGGVAAAAVVGTLLVKSGGDDSKEETVNYSSMDSGKDGSLSRDEFTASMSKAFTSADKDGSGSVTRDEAVAAYGDRGGKYYDALDTQNRGSITMSTLENDAKQAFDWADANGDGTITADERSKAATAHTAAEAEQKANPGKAKAIRLLKKVT